MKKDVPYTPISRNVRKSGLFTSRAGRVYLAPDHVMLLINEHFSEKYRRFYFQDIQSIEIMRTRSRDLTSRIMLAIITFLVIWAFIGVSFWGWGGLGVGIMSFFV